MKEIIKTKNLKINTEGYYQKEIKVFITKRKLNMVDISIKILEIIKGEPVEKEFIESIIREKNMIELEN